ncbi:hypothetical protein Pmani_019566 [Petrolisthes manimaculis]|uniref:Vitellogenin n=1 Tax=Petrolisthes manimaculis TaxID=1843537 RepID=A0AAE1PK58_9EUCA|nr:hypothetical protein Pmani_019566 [Petrolisthes manimaculis]
MRLLAFCTLLLLEWSSGLQVGVEYQYRYNGQVENSVSPNHDQLAVIAIRSDITLQLTQEGVAIFKLSNVETGNFHGNTTTCDHHHVNSSYIGYEPLHADTLSHPFTLYFNQSQTLHLDTPEEPEWVTNIRRAVVSVFNIPMLRGQHTFTPNFYSVEETMAGFCGTWNTIIKLPEYQASIEKQQQEARIEEDVQQSGTAATSSGSYTAKTAGRKQTSSKTSGRGRKTSKTTGGRLTQAGPQIKPDYWILNRHVEFEKCHGGFFSKINIGKNTDVTVKQNSGGRYTLRGDVDAWRLEEAAVEGSVTLSNGDTDDEYIASFTIQTVQLVAVRLIQTELTVTYPPHRHYSLNYKPQNRPFSNLVESLGLSLEEAVTGVPMTQQYLIDSQALIIENIEAILTSVYRGLANNIPVSDYFTSSVERLSYFTKAELDTLYSKLPRGNPEEINLTETVMSLMVVSAGTDSGVEFALEKIRQGSFPRHAQNWMFNQLYHTLKNPNLLPRLIELALNLPWEGTEDAQQSKTVALLSTTKLANKLCFSSERRHTTYSGNCDTEHTCQPEYIISTVIPTLTHTLQNTEYPEWKRLVSLQGLCNLGTPSIIPVIKDVALGLNQPTRFMRLVAVSCLQFSEEMYLPWTARYPVTSDILMPLLMNIGELPEIRSVAFLSMITWIPTQQWWNNMALSTWHEPSKQVANFISSVITSFATSSLPLSDLASNAKVLAKPATISPTRSTGVFLHELLHNCKTREFSRIAWLSATKEVFPPVVVFQLITSGFFGVTEYTDTVIYQQGFLKDIAKKLRTFKPSGTSDEVLLVLDMFVELKEDLGMLPTEPVIDHQAWFRFNLRFLMQSVIAMLDREREGNAIVNYICDQDSSIVLPTDIGLPLVIKFTRDRVNQVYTPQTPYDTPGLGQEMLLRVHWSSSQHFTMKTLVPWNHGSVVESGLRSTDSFSLDFLIRLARTRTGGKITVKPFSHDTINVIQLCNVPYTSIGPLYMDTLTTDHHPIYQLHINEEGEVLPSTTGISLHYSWSADIPLSFSSIKNWVLTMNRPAYKNYRFTVTLAPQLSITKEVVIHFMHSMVQQSQRIVETEPEDFGQVSQGASDYNYMSQVSQSASASDFEEFDQEFGQEIGVGNEAEGSDQFAFARLQEQTLVDDGGRVITIGASVEFMSETPGSKYETVLTWSGRTDRVVSRILLGFTSHPPVNQLQDPTATCFDLTIHRPQFPPRRLDVVTSDLHKTFNLQVQRGTSCNSDPPVMRVQIDMEASQHSLNHVVHQLQEKDCNSDIDQKLRPMRVYISPVYDHINLHATWTQGFPDTLLNLTQHVDDHLRAWLDPIITYDHTVTNPGYHLLINATKNVEVDDWTVRSQLPQAVSLVEHLHLPSVISHLITAPAPLTKTFFFNYINDRTKSMCVVGESKVQTYDGKVYNFSPSECWSTLSIDYANKHEDTDVSKVELSIQVRFTDQWEVRLMYPWTGSIVEFNRAHVKLNEEELTEPQPDRVQYYTDGGSMFVFATGTVVVEVADQVSLWMSEVHYNSVRGLCGNYDNEADNDLTGPKGCLYTDPELFASAWTTTGRGCNRFNLNREKRKVTAYQESCPNQFYHPTGVTQPNVTENCIDWEYKEVTQGQLQCRSLVQIPTCKPGCTPAFIRDAMVEYDCPSLTEGDHQEIQCTTIPYHTTFPAKCINVH